MKRALIVGMGIGQLYQQIYDRLKWDIVTVDPFPGKLADAKFITEVTGHFDVAHVCTPNFLHEEIADACAKISDIVFVEKPGLETASQWQQLIQRHPNSRIMMVKNNMWRNDIDPVGDATALDISWMNKNRVPNPGSWFTTKERAWGGVSRDLIPHLLSIFAALVIDYRSAKVVEQSSKRVWTLADLMNTEYGIVNPIGTYNVDDVAKIMLEYKNKIFCLEANWRTNTEDDRAVHYYKNGKEVAVCELGLCPEEAYQLMIEEAVANIDNDHWWTIQNDIDLWIHEHLDNFG